MARLLDQKRLQYEIWLLELDRAGKMPRRLFATADSRIREIGFATP